MKNYGFINNLGELKLIQNNVYKGDGKFIGITRNGGAYIHTGTESKQLSREEVGSYLNLTPDQVDSVIRSRGKVDFGSSKENGGSNMLKSKESIGVKKFENTQQVRAEIKDTPRGREKTDAKASTVEASKVNPDHKDFDGAVSLDKSEIKSLSLKNQVRYMRNRLKWIEENYVSKEQMIEIIQAILQEK